MLYPYEDNQIIVQLQGVLWHYFVQVQVEKVSVQKVYCTLPIYELVIALFTCNNKQFNWWKAE